MINRRNFLRTSLLGLASGSGFATSLASFNAFAQDATDYKALVCVFLGGGADNHDTLLPYDRTSYQDFERLREPLLAGYDRNSPRRRENLISLGGGGDGREFAFPTELSKLGDLYHSGDLAIVGNVGPLIEPVNRQSFESGSRRIPRKLFSHNDQASTWMTSQPSDVGASGWGGRFAEILNASQSNINSSFTSISMDKIYPFAIGDDVVPFVMSRDGPRSVDNLNKAHLGSETFAESFERVLRGSTDNDDSLFQRDLRRVLNSSLNNNQMLGAELSLQPSLSQAYPQTHSGKELEIVARTISRRQQLGMKRQIFFVMAHGYDTHSDQASTLPGLQTSLSDSLSAFYESMVEMGLEENVTVFTASDFGRTLGVNGDGTDHGWGSHHFVMGGAVNGGNLYGHVPPAELGHDYDAGRGRLIPQISVDQYVAALGSWFGLTNGDLRDAIPGLDNFDGSELNGLFK